MTASHFFAGCIAMAFAVVFASSNSEAQVRAAALPPTDQAPTMPNLVKPFTNWVVRCYPVSSPVPCEMFQMATVAKTRKRALSLSIVYMPSTNRYLIQIALPGGVDLLKGVIIRSSSYTSKALPYRRCDHTGCFVETVIDNGAIAALSRASTSGTVQVAVFRGRTLLMPLSFKGFGAANRALVDLARQKASSPPPSAH